MQTPAQRLRALLARPGLIAMPCCGDAHGARLIEQAGFELTFVSGFAASVQRIGAPDVGLASYGEMRDAGRDIAAAVSIPVMGDGDTGWGNALNVYRTVQGFARAGLAGIMIEDQVAPKRCGHTRGKKVVDRLEAEDRIRAAVDARNDGADILIQARTDARHELGLGEAIERMNRFREIGADILFIEAPQSAAEMRTICREVAGHHVANMLEGGLTPILPQAELAEIGFKIAAYPLTLLSAATKAMQGALEGLKADRDVTQMVLPFAELRRVVGFEDYYVAEARYARPRDMTRG
jgi:2-methylisocitrate lyase-like PEP mutase family enzyme